MLLLTLTAAQAQPVKRLYLANDDHTDLMWTGTEAQYDSAFVRMLDYYLAHIDSTQGNPDDFQTRFNLDGSHWIRVYEKHRPAQFPRLVARLRSGHLSSPLNSLVSTYGGQPTEAVLRGMYDAGALERAHRLRFRLAVCMENQTLPLGLASLWAGSGARWSWRGVCGCASRIPNQSLAGRRHQLYRYLGTDGTGVTMKWYALPAENTGLGGYGETRQRKKPTDAVADLSKTIADLTALCDTASTRSAYPFNAAGAFGYGWDDLETFVAPQFVAAARQHSTPTRRVRVSNEEDFFRDVEKSYPNLPSESVSYGNEWDLYPVSMNETTAQVRRATEKLRAAEALAALVSVNDSTFGRDLTAARQAAWQAYGLYWEHDWTADGPVSRQARADWQVKQKSAIVGYVDSLHRRAVTGLGRQLKAAANPRFYAFNPLNWARSDYADVAYENPQPVRVVDLSTGREVASQAVFKAGKRHLRFWAEAIPSVGFKVFEIQPGAPTRQPDAATVRGDVIENAFHRLRLRKSGLIAEWTDRKAGNRPLVQPLHGRGFNDLGTQNPDAGEALVVENRGPVSVTLKATSNDPVAHTVKLTLYRNSPRIDVEDSIRANFGDVKTWAFSFNLKNPTTRHEELGAVLTAKKETRGGHYAAQNARLDWQTFNHFADLSEAGGYGVTVSNQDCSFFRLGQSSPDSLWETSPQLHALAGGQVDGPNLGIVAQNGETNFRYAFALTTHAAAFDPVAAMKFALEHQNPLVTGAVTGAADDYPAGTHSFLSVNDPTVLLWSLKPGEEGGLVGRFWNLKNKAAAPTLRLARPVRQAWQTTHLETTERPLPLANGRLALRFAPNQLTTYRLQLAR